MVYYYYTTLKTEEIIFIQELLTETNPLDGNGQE
jgi:hypothetical protein